MRPIKFRGRLDNGEWVEGYYSEFALCDGLGRCSYIKTDGSQPIKVDPATVGQYWRTVNKHPLFDGDIVKVGDVVKVVAYREDKACFCLANVCQLNEEAYGDIWQTPGVVWWEEFEKEITVIGNIHDNPELLKTE